MFSVEHFGRGLVAQSLIGSQVVVEPEVGSQFQSCLDGVDVGFQVDLLVLHRPPQPLHEDVALVPALPVHADLHTSVLKDLGELPAAELTALVGIEHLGPAPGQRLRKRFGAKYRRERVLVLSSKQRVRMCRENVEGSVEAVCVLQARHPAPDYTFSVVEN